MKINLTTSNYNLRSYVNFKLQDLNYKKNVNDYVNEKNQIELVDISNIQTLEELNKYLHQFKAQTNIVFFGKNTPMAFVLEIKEKTQHDFIPFDSNFIIFLDRYLQKRINQPKWVEQIEKEKRAGDKEKIKMFLFFSVIILMIILV